MGWHEERKQLRNDNCNRCAYCISTDPMEHKTNKCEVTKHEGKTIRGQYCPYFKPRITCDSDATAADGFRIRSQMASDFRTRNQWLEAGYKPKGGAEGEQMHSTSLGKRLYTYYLPEQVEKV